MASASSSDPIVLPNWSDPTSIAGFIVSTFTMVAGLLAAMHVIIPAGVSANVQLYASLAGFVIAGLAQAFNAWRIHNTTKTAIRYGHPTLVLTSARQQTKIALAYQRREGIGNEPKAA